MVISTAAAFGIKRKYVLKETIILRVFFAAGEMYAKTRLRSGFLHHFPDFRNFTLVCRRNKNAKKQQFCGEKFERKNSCTTKKSWLFATGENLRSVLGCKIIWDAMKTCETS